MELRALMALQNERCRCESVFRGSMQVKSYLKTSASRVALLFLGTLSSSRRLPARALSARRLSLSSGHVGIDYGLWMMASDG